MLGGMKKFKKLEKVTWESGGACGRKGRFLKKAPQKLFLGGQLNFASFLTENPWILCQSEAHKGKRKRAFFFPYVPQTL